MRAVEVARFGGPDVLELQELSDPVPDLGQVVVAASASDVLFVDTMIRSGRGADYFPIRPPYVPGNGVGGTVAGVGAGVDASWLGRPVVAHTGGAGGTGGYAEMAAVDLEACAPLPDGVDLLDATAVLHDGTTALRVLETTAPQQGELALVLGAAGGMGILLVQLLVARGVMVVGAVSTARPAGPMRSSTPPVGAARRWCSTGSAARSAERRSGCSPMVDGFRPTAPRAARSQR
jgi:NADPH2:quinone reductase